MYARSVFTHEPGESAQPVHWGWIEWNSDVVSHRSEAHWFTPCMTFDLTRQQGAIEEETLVPPAEPYP